MASSEGLSNEYVLFIFLAAGVFPFSIENCGQEIPFSLVLFLPRALALKFLLWCCYGAALLACAGALKWRGMAGVPKCCGDSRRKKQGHSSNMSTVGLRSIMSCKRNDLFNM